MMKKYLFMLFCLLLSMNVFAAEFDYWREQQDTTNVWVNVTLQPGESKILDMSNLSGVPENPEGVFIFFDDFDDGSIDGAKWTTLTDTSGGGSCSVTESGGAVNVNGIGTIGGAACRLVSKFNVSTGYMMESYTDIDGDGAGSDGRYMGWHDAANDNVQDPFGAFMHVIRNNEATQEQIVSNDSNFNFTSTSFTTGSLRIFSLGNLQNESFFTENRGTKNLLDLTYNVPMGDMEVTFQDKDVGAVNSGSLISSEWVFVRSLVAEEPTVTTVSTSSSNHILNVTNTGDTVLEGYSVLVSTSLTGNVSVTEVVAPTFNETLQNATLVGNAVYNWTLNWSGTNDALVTSDSAFASIVTFNDTQTANVTYSPPITAFVEDVVFTVQNGDGSDQFTVTFTVVSPVPGDVCDGNDAFSLCSILAGTGIGFNALFSFVASEGVFLFVAVALTLICCSLLNNIGDGLGNSFKNLFKK